MNKIIYPLLVAVAVIGVLIIAFFALNNYIYQEKQADDGSIINETINLSGVVTAIDLEPVMADGPARITIETESGEIEEIDIPSMGMQLCAAKQNITAPQFVLMGDLVDVSGQKDEEGIVVPCEDIAHYFKVKGVVEAPDVSLKFSYPKGERGYVLESGIPQMSVDPNFITGYMLTLESDAAELADSSEPREGPPTIQVRVYENPDKEQPGNWAEAHPLESNIELAFGDREEAVVGGANAVGYTADGLYASKVYIVASNNFIYVFTAAYIDDQSPTLRDFGDLLKSVEFITDEGETNSSASSGVPGKIRADVFTGVLQAVHTGCFADGECFVTVDGKKVTALVGFSNEEVGSVIGVEGFGDLENHLGETVEVYAQDFNDGTYTLYGSEGFYIKLLD